ncbi:MAG: hypothetical protein ACM3JD_04920 [Rudaea sp.]
MAQLGQSLLKKITANPNSSQDSIVRVSGDMDAAQDKLESAGFRIRRRLGLIKGFAVTGKGRALQDLAAQPWVTSIEEDQQVRTQGRSGS